MNSIAYRSPADVHQGGEQGAVAPVGGNPQTSLGKNLIILDDHDIFSPTILEGGISSVLDDHPPAGLVLQRGAWVAIKSDVLIRLYYNRVLVPFTYETRHENFSQGCMFVGVSKKHYARTQITVKNIPF